MSQTESSKEHSFRLSVRLAAFVLFPIIIVATFGIMTKVVDLFIDARHIPKPSVPEEMQPIVFDWYPYSVGHMGANMIWDGEIRIGQMGYWYPDFDFNNPPKKKSNEYRIVLVGGSGAQGQGGTWPNELMLYSQLQSRLNQHLSHMGKKFVVINMAMGGSRTYHNFVDLNLFAHRLEPDMILTYSGFNDWSIPYFFEHDQRLFAPASVNHSGTTTQPFRTLMASFIDWDAISRTLTQWYPNLLQRVGNKTTLRKFFLSRPAFNAWAPEEGLKFESRLSYFEQYILPLYIGSLKSIRRDFSGIPILVAWQSIELRPDEFQPFGDPQNNLHRDFYNQMFQSAKSATHTYGNGDWIYINTHRMYQYDPRLFGFHMTLEAQAAIGDAIAQRIALYLDPEYASENPKIAKAIIDETYGVTEDLNRPPGKPGEWAEASYLFANPDVAKLVEKGIYTSGREYFEELGQTEGKLEGSPLKWDEYDYLHTNPDVVKSIRLGHISSGLEHWVIAGRHEDRKGGLVPNAPLPALVSSTAENAPPASILVVPNAPEWWDEKLYLKTNPDVANAVRSKSFANGYDHWLKAGRAEGRGGANRQ